MSEKNENIVDGDVEILDLDELRQVIGGAALLEVARLPIERPRLDIQRASVLMANDGWQGPAFNASDAPALYGSVLMENDGWQGAAFNGGDVAAPGGGSVLMENDGWQGAVFNVREDG